VELYFRSNMPSYYDAQLSTTATSLLLQAYIPGGYTRQYEGEDPERAVAIPTSLRGFLRVPQ
jgi:hypothetical protein